MSNPLPISASHAPRFGGGPARLACFFACVALAAAALVRIHDRQWNGYDDGTYLHIADRVAHGEVLNRDIQDVHFGYVTFANAAALRVFGDDAVSLRYPLVMMGVANAAIAFWLLAGAGTLSASVGSLAVTAMSCVQFMNPSAHWYALFMTLATIGAITWLPPRWAGRPVCVGFLVGAVVLFRQLTGVFVLAPVVFYLLLELPQDARGGRAWLGRSVVAFLGAGLAAYLLRKTDVVALLMFGVWPIAIMAWAATHLSAPNGDVFKLLCRFAAGGLVAAMPLVAYHVLTDSVRPWLNDTVFGALSLTRLDFIDDLKYWMNMTAGASALLHPRGPAKALVGAFWLVAPALPMLLGVMVTWKFWRPRPLDESGAVGVPVPPVALVALVAVFYFMVALHYQKWMYFFFGVPLTAAGLLALAPAAWPRLRCVLAAGLAALSTIAFFLLASPFPRLMPGHPAPPVADHGIPRCSIRLDPATVEAYRGVLALVNREVGPEEAILSLPVQPELYYLTGRRNPTRFDNSALALRNGEDVRALEVTLEHEPPKVVFFNPTNHYTTHPCLELMDWIHGRYEPAGKFGPFEAYRLRASGAPPASAPPVAGR